MHAEITAYKGRIVIELKTPRSVPGEVITSIDNPRFPGQAICDTGKNLGISEEALALLKDVRRGEAMAGDVSWSRSEDGKTVFCWKGGRYAIFSPENCEAAANYKIRKYVSIPNEVPAGARRQLDSLPTLPERRKGILTGAEL